MAKNLDWYIEKYGLEDGTERHTAIRKNIGASSVGKNSLNGFIKRYGEEDGKRKYNEFVSKSIQNLDKFIEKYGLIEGSIKYAEYCDNKTRNFPGKVSYWTSLGFSSDIAKTLVASSQNTCSLSKFIERYGEDVGTDKYISKCKNHSFAVSIGGFIEKYGDEEGRKRFFEYNKQKSCSLESFIMRDGEAEGTRKYNEKCKNISESQLKENYIEKHGIEKWHKRYSRTTKYSKESIRYLLGIYKILRRNGVKKDDVYWGIHPHKEYFLIDGVGDIFFYDFTIPKLKLIIEYHGVAFHPKEWDHDWKSAYGVSYADAITKARIKLLANSL